VPRGIDKLCWIESFASIGLKFQVMINIYRALCAGKLCLSIRLVDNPNRNYLEESCFYLRLTKEKQRLPAAGAFLK
jgi:hypothetical protein